VALFLPFEEFSIVYYGALTIQSIQCKKTGRTKPWKMSVGNFIFPNKRVLLVNLPKLHPFGGKKSFPALRED